MSYGFHKNTRIYVDAVQRAGFTSFSFQNEKLIDDLVRQLNFNQCWDRVNGIWICANDGSVDVSCVNLRQPTKVVGALSGSVGWASKQGICGPGTILTGFDPLTHYLFLPQAADTSFWGYMTVGGSAVVTTADVLFGWAVSGGNYQIIRNRTNPRVDAIVNTTVANPFQIVATATQNNTLYYCDMGNVLASVTRTSWTNKTLRTSATGTGAGVLPVGGTINAGGLMETNRKLGGFGTGLSLHGAGRYDVAGGFADAMKTYFDAVQLL